MNSALFGTGLACVIGAIVGGGLKGFGLEFPPLESVRRQAMLAGVGVVLIIASTWPANGFGGDKVKSGSVVAQKQIPMKPPTTVKPKDATAPAKNSVQTVPAPKTTTVNVDTGIMDTDQGLGSDQNYQALKVQIEGASNRQRLAIRDHDTDACQDNLDRWRNLQVNLKAVLVSHKIKVIPPNLRSPADTVCNDLGPTG